MKNACFNIIAYYFISGVTAPGLTKPKLKLPPEPGGCESSLQPSIRKTRITSRSPVLLQLYKVVISWLKSF